MRKYGKWLLVLGILAASPGWASADGVLGGVRQSQSSLKEMNQRKAEQVAAALSRLVSVDTILQWKCGDPQFELTARSGMSLTKHLQNEPAAAMQESIRF